MISGFHRPPIPTGQGLHVKIPENYFKILEEGKNVGKFIFRRNAKIPENEPRKRKNPGIFFGNNV